MSTAYYLVNEKRRQESDKLNEFWEKTFLPKIESILSTYFNENKGEYINDDLLEDIMDSEPFSRLKYCCPDYWRDCETRIGTKAYDKFHWNYDCYIDDGTKISDATPEKTIDNLCRFLKNNPEYRIYDEYASVISINEFRKIANIS